MYKNEVQNEKFARSQSLGQPLCQGLHSSHCHTASHQVTAAQRDIRDIQILAFPKQHQSQQGKDSDVTTWPYDHLQVYLGIKLARYSGLGVRGQEECVADSSHGKVRWEGRSEQQVPRSHVCQQHPLGLWKQDGHPWRWTRAGLTLWGTSQYVTRHVLGARHVHVSPLGSLVPGGTLWHSLSCLTDILHRGPEESELLHYCTVSLPLRAS